MPTQKCAATILQLNPCVGDIAGNIGKIRETYIEADDRGVDLVVTPAWSVTGFPLGGLMRDRDFLDAADAAVRELAGATRDRKACLLVGAPRRDAGELWAAAFALRDGGVHLAARGVWGCPTGDFPASEEGAKPLALGDARLGVLLADDILRPGPALALRDAGAEILVSMNACPFRPGALRRRVTEIAAARVHETGLPVLYVNMVGGQDETVFDGGSFYLDATSCRAAQLPQWEECDMDCELSGPFTALPGDEFPSDLENLWRAMVVGVRDYVGKSGFTDVVLGMSGGMDSALVAAVAADALGPARVHCVRLPSRHTSDLSNATAEDMCRRWGMDLLTLPIGPTVAAAAETLAPAAPDGLKRLTQENMQARARGYLLMTLSNDRGWLLLSTGNKSEGSVGYATLYGDMCGAFNPVKDIFKTTVFALARWRNRNCPEGLLGPTGEVIPTEIIERPPSAELSPGQKDTDSLPPYHILDAILEAMLEKREPLASIVGQGFDPETVERVFRMLRLSEYKRRQACPGVMVSGGPGAEDMRPPMVNRFVPGGRGR